MKKMLLFTFFVFFVCSSNIRQKKYFYQEQDSDTLNWSSNKKLIWENFQGQPDKNLMNKALTYAGLKIKNGYWQEGIPKINVICYFIKSKSWVKVKNDANLTHEQLHFDIWELYGRKIRKSFDSLNVKKIKNINVYYSIYESYGEKCIKYHDLYDSKVYFNEERQQQWIKNIAIELKQLKRYEYISEE